jgi:hypothetical protein
MRNSQTEHSCCSTLVRKDANIPRPYQINQTAPPSSTDCRRAQLPSAFTAGLKSPKARREQLHARDATRFAEPSQKSAEAKKRLVVLSVIREMSGPSSTVLLPRRCGGYAPTDRPSGEGASWMVTNLNGPAEAVTGTGESLAKPVHITVTCAGVQAARCGAQNVALATKKNPHGFSPRPTQSSSAGRLSARSSGRRCLGCFSS